MSKLNPNWANEILFLHFSQYYHHHPSFLFVQTTGKSRFHQARDRIKAGATHQKLKTQREGLSKRTRDTEKSSYKK